DISSGAQSDIEQATKIARQMILTWGMSDRLGPVNYGDTGMRDYSFVMSPEKEYSEKTAEAIDGEVKRILDEAYTDAQELIEKHKKQLEGIAQALLKYETLDADDVHEALRAAEGHRLTLLDGDRRDVLPGIHVVLGADSHTFGSQYVIVETTVRGPVVVAGDCAYSYANLTGLDGNGRYIPLGFGVGSHYQSLMVLDRMMQEVDGDLSRIIVLHDFERWERFPVEREDDGFRIARV
ncbi:MAG: hypothetical protein P1P87_04625, partial [Trueperaceae bacterium]|nr:hypothetical protein [Trueperaceae bacterium]